MYEILVHPGPKTELVQSPIPTPNDDQVVIKVVVSGSNPKDWKRPEWYKVALNQGDDIAGIVHQVGANVTEFKVGDRVAAFHEMMSPHGSYAEYAVAWAYTTFHIPAKTSFEEAATIPLAALTAGMGLFSRLALPGPWARAQKPIPLIIYGGSSAVGSFAIKLANRADIHPLFVIAGKGAPYVETLIDATKGDRIIDYRQGPDAVANSLKEALTASGLEKEGFKHAFDTITNDVSYRTISSVLDPAAAITVVLNYDENVFPSTVTHSRTAVGGVHRQVGYWPGDPDLGFVFSKLFSQGLKEGWFTAHPYKVWPNGLASVEPALQELKAGKNSALKYVFRIAETPEVAQTQ